MITLSEKIQAEKKLTEINGKREEAKKKIDSLKSEAYNRKWKAERRVQDEHYEEMRIIADKEEEISKRFKSISEKSNEVMAEYRKIIEYMDILENSKELEKPEIYKFVRYGDKKEYYKPIYSIQENEYASVFAYIVENDKPKNKFSLAIIGNSIFEMDGFKYYGLSTHSEEYPQIQIKIKDFPTYAEAMSYYQKKSGNVKRELYEALNEKAKFYEKVKKLAESKEWRIEYLKDKKEYYSRFIDRSGYPEYTEKYNSINQELIQLQGA